MARKLVNTKEISHEQWLELRRKSLGGSDAASCVNMNPYSGLLSLYANKKGLSKDKEDNEAMRLGRDLEQYVADRFMEVTGKKLVNDNFFYLDDDYDFISANVDRRVVGENAGFEAKTMGNFSGYNIEAGDIPSHYYCQCQHYCMVRGWDRVYIGILVLQRGFYWHEIKRDDDFIKALREAEIGFWTQYIMQDRMPEPDGESDFDTLKQIYPREMPSSEITIAGLDRMVTDYKSLKAIADDYGKQAERYKAQICQKLGDNEIGLGVQYGVSWKTQSKTSGYDMKRLQEDYPNINIEKYKKVSEYRVFRTKDLTKKKGKQK